MLLNKILCILLLLFITSCAKQNPENISDPEVVKNGVVAIRIKSKSITDEFVYKFVDKTNDTSCYIYERNISCVKN